MRRIYTQEQIANYCPQVLSYLNAKTRKLGEEVRTGRVQKGRRIVSVTHSNQPLTPPVDDFDPQRHIDIVLAEEAITALDHVIKPHYLEVLRLRFVEGHTQTEIAELFGCCRQTIRGIESKAKTSARSYLRTKRLI